jgi:hypothetical protein
MTGIVRGPIHYKGLRIGKVSAAVVTPPKNVAPEGLQHLLV